MKAMERYVYLGIILLLAAGCLYLGWGRGPADNSAALAEQPWQVVDQPAQPAPSADRPVVRLDPGDLRDLQNLGLTDPVNQIVTDLAARQDLLPIQGVLGGTMSFHPSDRWVVAKNWVLADFDDGHILGWGIFKYTVANGKITWTRLDWTQP
ncbi:MAG TPA: hypothetical protein VD969_07600 [Symbiobacteriaceae bacterium]|nr:hypothetical protein [Symbiobacteriaceae bacterium]